MDAQWNLLMAYNICIAHAGSVSYSSAILCWGNYPYWH